MLEVKETTFEVDGWQEPCWIVTDGWCTVRISKMHHYISKDTLYMYETHDGEYNSSDEWTGDFDLIDEEEALELAKRYSVYLDR